MKTSYCDIYEAVKWTHKCDVPSLELDSYDENIFNLEIKSSGVVDGEEKINEHEDLEIKVDLGKFILTLTQHQIYLINKWINESKKTYNEKDLIPAYTYEFEVRDKDSGTTSVFSIALDKMKIIDELPNGRPVEAEHEIDSGAVKVDQFKVNGNHLEVIQELGDDPFDTDFD